MQQRTPTTETPAGNQRNTDFFPKCIASKNNDLVKKYPQDRVKSLHDPNIQNMVSGMHFKISDNLPAVNQYPFSKNKQEFITAEIKTLLAKSVIFRNKAWVKEIYFIHIFCEKSDCDVRLILYFKRLNEVIEQKKFKTETISTIFYISTISLQPSLFKFTVLPKWYKEGTKEIYKTYETSFGILKKNWKTSSWWLLWRPYPNEKYK